MTEADALAALQAANTIAGAPKQIAWKVISTHGNLEVNGGTFDVRSVKRIIITAETGKLIWNGGDLASSGGGDTILQGAAGIDILGGSIKSSGTVEGKATAIQYDDRRRLNRDRWTLGTYLAFVSTGDINVGRRGQHPGPDIHLSDGMLKIGNLTISGGTINVREQSFIGAIRGDSQAQSPYPTTQQISLSRVEH